jgi:hypothetical protein
VSTPDPALPAVFGRTDAAAAGLSNGQISRRLGAGRWTRLRPGRFAPVADLDEHARWRSQIVAELVEHPRRTLVLSHAHAARAWGWPVPLGGSGPLTFTDPSGPVRRGRIRISVAPLDPTEVTATSIPVTSPARTVIDCARTLAARDALAIADAALASGRVTPLALQVALARAKGWPGSRQARRVVDLSDARRETALESWSAWAFDEQGLPAPLWQVEIRDVAGVLLGRVDAWWREGVAGEADGRAKYRVRARERGDGGLEGFESVLHEERVREMQLRRTGAQLVRWEPRDVLMATRAAELAGYIRGQLVAARGLPFDGSVRLPPRRP